ncbi:hypothetical protein [Altibacter sp. HG106]|uniref:hypothetical protein n=1 Tax=Altibacter sp. HG106 TaxID=3023937 RepID=UPI0023500374|nr:hypothetical protein [Altibacter sp. HG106]MDC7995250.1 hypothetical protein [Altibacter sp. HG106]
MKKSILTTAIVICLSGLFLLNSCIISDSKPEHCEVTTVNVQAISEGTSNDITLTDSEGASYYINRGLENGLTLAQLNEDILNKTVTLHLAKTLLGTSDHIAQITVNEAVVYSEF